MQHPQIPLRYDATQADQLSQVFTLRSSRIDNSRRHAFDNRLRLVQAIEIMPGRLYMAALRTSDGLHRSTIASGSITYCIDSELVRSSAIFTAFSMPMMRWQQKAFTA